MATPDISSTVTTNPESQKEIHLHDTFIAGVLAWLVPGLGHLYQGRYVKSALFFFMIVPTLLAGIWMGSYTDFDVPEGNSAPQIQIGRNIWCSFRDGDKRLYFIPQAMIGTVTAIAIAQTRNVANGNDPFCFGLFAPPSLDASTAKNPSLNRILEHLHSWYDPGLLFTVVAGLMNLLAFFDAIAGPVFPTSEEEETKEEDKPATSSP